MQNNNISVGQLNNLKHEPCEKCGCPFYKDQTIIKKNPALLAAMKTDQYYPITYLVCKHCEYPHMGLLSLQGLNNIPVFVKEDTTKKTQG